MSSRGHHAQTAVSSGQPAVGSAEPALDSSEPETRPILSAHDLMAAGPIGTIYGPVDLELHPGDLCLVNGVEGSGKSAFLMTLASRFRGVTGSLEINGRDALADPYTVMQDTAVARLGNYVAPEDRLTLEESISERAYLDGISLAQAESRALEIEQLLGYRVERGVEIESLDPVTRAIVSVALVMLRPASVVVIDDVDLRVPHTEQKTMYELLLKLTQLDGSTIIASAIDGDSAPRGTVRVRLASRRTSSVHAIAGDGSAAVEVVADDPRIAADPVLTEDADAVVVRYGDDDSRATVEDRKATDEGEEK
ncbi:ATP-binding cassette domain-containing protein [Actinomycetaceae bacterium L2_0104]